MTGLHLGEIDHTDAGDLLHYLQTQGADVPDEFRAGERAAVVRRDGHLTGAAWFRRRSQVAGQRLHALQADDAEAWRLLVDWVRGQVPGDHAIVFYDEQADTTAIDAVTGLGGRAMKRTLYLECDLPGAAPGPSDVVVAPVEASRADAVVAQWRRAEAEHGERAGLTVDEVLSAAEDEDRVFLQGTLGHELVATGAADVWEGLGWYGVLSVAPAFRGKGYGRQMLRALMRWTHERGAARGSLSVQATNEAAVRLYADEGFEVVQRLVALVIEGEGHTATSA